MGKNIKHIQMRFKVFLLFIQIFPIPFENPAIQKSSINN